MKSSIGKKQVMAVTGLLLTGFLISHLAGNLLMLKGPGAFDAYAESLEHFPLLIPIELVLAAIFLSHIGLGIKLTLENKNARPEPYAAHAPAGGSTFASSTMIYTGLLAALFLVLHVATFKFQHPEGESLFGWVMSWFRIPLYVGFYVLAVAGIGVHLSHGIRSAFQTLGIYHPSYTPGIKAAGILLAVLLGVGFAMLPLWGFLR